MKPKATLRHFLCVASSSMLALPSAHAATGWWTGMPGAWSDTTDPGCVRAGVIVADDAGITANFTGVNAALIGNDLNHASSYPPARRNTLV